MLDRVRPIANHPRDPRKMNMIPFFALLILCLGGCESEVVAPPEEEVFEEGELMIDASSHSDFVYLNLSDGTLVTPADPASSTEWHMAFRRFFVRLNGGVAGSGSVAGCNLAHNAGLDADRVAALAAADGEAAFDAVTEADIPATSSFVEDGLVQAPANAWFRFDPQTSSLTTIPSVAWKLRESSDRGFAVFRFSSIQMQGQRPVGVEVEYRRQDPGGALGEMQTAVADLTRGPAFIGFSGADMPQAASCDWDIGGSPDFSVVVNGACGAGTFPLDVTQDFTAVTRADDAPEYADYLSDISGAFPADVDGAAGTYWYGIQDNSRMWPTYNVFLVDTGQEVYKVQIFDYYNATGTSGFPSVRFQRLR